MTALKGENEELKKMVVVRDEKIIALEQLVESKKRKRQDTAMTSEGESVVHERVKRYRGNGSNEALGEIQLKQPVNRHTLVDHLQVGGENKENVNRNVKGGVTTRKHGE